MCFGQAVGALRGYATNAEAGLTLILHDWGTAPGTIWANRALAKTATTDAGRPPYKVIYLDVLPRSASVPLAKSRPQTLYERLVHLNYWALFATSFLLSRLSNTLATIYMGVFSTLVFGVFGNWLSPVGRRDAEPGMGATIKKPWILPQLCYPYFHLFREMIVSSAALVKEFHLPDLNKVQVLYLFGKEKNTMFHTQESIDELMTAGCKVVEVKSAGHWMLHQEPEECYAHILPFIETNL